MCEMLQAKVGAFTFATELNLLARLHVKAPNRYFFRMLLPVFFFTLPAPATRLGVAGVRETACILVRRP